MKDTFNINLIKLPILRTNEPTRSSRTCYSDDVFIIPPNVVCLPLKRTPEKVSAIMGYYYAGTDACIV